MPAPPDAAEAPSTSRAAEMAVGHEPDEHVSQDSATRHAAGTSAGDDTGGTPVSDIAHVSDERADPDRSAPTAAADHGAGSIFVSEAGTAAAAGRIAAPSTVLDAASRTTAAEAVSAPTRCEGDTAEREAPPSAAPYASNDGTVADTAPAMLADEGDAMARGAAPSAASEAATDTTAAGAALVAPADEGDEAEREPITSTAPEIADDATAEDPASASPPGEGGAAEAPPDPALFAHALRIAEALVFASDRPVTPARLGGALPPGCDPRAVLTALSAACAGRAVELVEVAGGFSFRTAPELAPAITRVVEAPRRLPRAAMETLAIVAYHQPVTRAEIEEIRGASLSQSTLELLLDAALIAPRGRKEVPGRPSLWGTTPRFLEQFGLKALGDLPRREELVNEPTLPLGAPPQQPTDAAPPPSA
jgi:segregation and condensation protein B